MLRTARLLAVAGMSVATVLPIKAMVIEPTLRDMIVEARQIIVTRAASSRSYWRSTPEGRVIETAVTFQVDAVIKGEFARERTLRFLGGRVGDVEMNVADQVEFDVGDHDLLFVNDADSPVSPIVGFMHGRFRIADDNQVLNYAGQAIQVDARDSGSPQLLESPMGQGLSLNAFIAYIRTTARTAGVDLR